MILKRKIVVLLMLFFMLIPSVASASLFYDLSGNTNIEFATGGLEIMASSYTDDPVDYIQVYSKVYANGQYLGFYINYKYDFNYTYILGLQNIYGFIQVSSEHDAHDWTGDEHVLSGDNIYR